MRAARLVPIGVFGIALTFLSTSASAQLPISVGGRIGESLTLSPGVEGTGGLSFDLVAAYRIRPTLSVYLMAGGAELGQFKPERDLDLESFALSAGVAVTLGPVVVGRPMPWFQAGVGVYDVSAYRDFPHFDEISPSRIGMELGAGVAVALTPRWHTTPALRIATFAPNWTFDDEGFTAKVGRVSYVTLDVGLAYNFGIREGR